LHLREARRESRQLLRGRSGGCRLWVKGNDAAITPRRGGAGDKRERERKQERTS